MDANFWKQKWIEGETRFHQSQYHPQLEKHANRYRDGKIMVPLCGKSLDMLSLTEKGHSVIGVELSPIACRDFFSENGIAYTESAVGEYLVFHSKKISLWCGDFFNLPDEAWINVEGLYDRAALIALPQEMRQRYANEITKRTSDKVEILLITLEYAQDALEGPPFSVSEEEVKRIYPKFQIQKLHSQKELRASKANPRLASVELVESVYWLSKS